MSNREALIKNQRAQFKEKFDLIYYKEHKVVVKARKVLNMLLNKYENVDSGRVSTADWADMSPDLNVSEITPALSNEVEQRYVISSNMLQLQK